MQALRKVFTSRTYFILFLLGFSSGLPAALTASTLQAWFTDAGINLKTIGAITLLVAPYTFRFLWAPVFDYFKIPGVDRRRGWLFVLQICLFVTIALMAFATPQDIAHIGSWSIPWLMLFGFLTALFSSSQDIVINAYQIEILKPEERALGAAISTTGWRVGSIISGAIALVLAKTWGWEQTYLLMASFMLVGFLATVFAPCTEAVKQASYKIYDLIVGPFQDFFQRFGFKTAIVFLLLIITYKAGDALALALNTTFLLRHVGFDLATVGLVNKTVSLVSALLGGLVAGVYMTRISLYRALMIFGLIQGAANLSYALMAYFGKSFSLLVLAAFTENFCSGMGTIALLALIMNLCNIQYTATQFALLSAVAFLARTIVGPIAAIMVEHLGWMLFFITCFIISLPTLLFVGVNKSTILSLKSNDAGTA